MKEETTYALANPENVNSSSEMMIRDGDFTWEKLLSPVPMSLAVLGQLVIIAANQKDFAIDHKRDKFKLIKYPESFRTSLLHISNQGYSSFAKAHSNMEQIRLMMLQVPTYVKDVNKILELGDMTLIEKMLPRRLKRIQEAASDCLERSSEVVDVFTQLGELISQVIDAALLSERFHKKGEQQQEKSRKLEEEKQMKLKEELRRKLEIKLERMEHLKNLEKIEDSNRQMAYHVLSKPVCFVERVSCWFDRDADDTNRRSGANKLASEATAQMEEVKSEIGQIEQEMKKINEEIIDNSQTTKVPCISAGNAVTLLRNISTNLVELKHQWAQLASYFNVINEVIEQASRSNEDANLTWENKALQKIIAVSTFKSRKYSDLTYRIADMYVSTSGRYIMSTVANLGKMIATSGNTEDAQRELMNCCQEASDGIREMVLANKNQLINDWDDCQTELLLDTRRLTEE